VGYSSTHGPRPWPNPRAARVQWESDRWDALEWLTNLANLLSSPIGTFILLVGVGYTGYLGVWRWNRELIREKEENRFLRGLIEQLAGVQEKQTQVNERAVTLAEVRARIRRDEGQDTS
jgi:hypothetical protein